MPAQTPMSLRSVIKEVWTNDPDRLRINLNGSQSAFYPPVLSGPLRPKNAFQYLKGERRGKKPSYRQRQASARAAISKRSKIGSY